MRRYRVVVTSPESSTTASNTATTVAVGKSYIVDSQTGGSVNTAALDIAFDLSVGPLGIATLGSYVEIFGVSISDVANIRRWQGGTLSIYGGFSSGFPLANASQYGLLARGYVLQCFGNWTGTNQSIVFILAPAGTDSQVVFHWSVGQSLSDAIKKSISASYNGFTIDNQLTADPVATVEDAHLCSSLYSLIEYITSKTKAMSLAVAVGGIQARISGTKVVLYDTPSSATPIKIDFDDFQGQPVNFGYGSSSTVQSTMNLRSDLGLSSKFTFPTQAIAGYSITQPATPAPLAKNSSVLKGTFMVNFVRHVGRFRDPPGLSWVTIVNGVLAS